MSEYKRDCPSCDRLTVHLHWDEGAGGDEISTAERLMFGVMTALMSELTITKHCRCLACGYERRIA